MRTDGHTLNIIDITDELKQKIESVITGFDSIEYDLDWDIDNVELRDCVIQKLENPIAVSLIEKYTSADSETYDVSRAYIIRFLIENKKVIIKMILRGGAGFIPSK